MDDRLAWRHSLAIQHLQAKIRLSGTYIQQIIHGYRSWFARDNTIMVERGSTQAAASKKFYIFKRTGASTSNLRFIWIAVNFSSKLFRSSSLKTKYYDIYTFVFFLAHPCRLLPYANLAFLFFLVHKGIYFLAKKKNSHGRCRHPQGKHPHGCLCCCATWKHLVNALQTWTGIDTSSN